MPRPKPDIPAVSFTVKLKPAGREHIRVRAAERSAAEGREVTDSEMARRMLAFAALKMPAAWNPPNPDH